jgi:hypothetical integral membrane protein (TIGR02206 family)
LPFGFAHFAIIAAIPALAGLLAWVVRRGGAARATPIRLALAAVLTANELAWYGYRLHYEGFRFPDGLPLHLCDIALWLTVAACLRPIPWRYELAWYFGVCGSGAAVLTPDLWAPWPSYPTIQFFLAHGFVVVAVLTMTWGGMMRPRPGSPWRALAALNVYAAATGAFNAAFGSNYLYLCRKPGNFSPLDWFGPWPYYLVAGEAAAAVAFALLWLPFRQRFKSQL